MLSFEVLRAILFKAYRDTLQVSLLRDLYRYLSYLRDESCWELNVDFQDVVSRDAASLFKNLCPLL